MRTKKVAVVVAMAVVSIGAMDAASATPGNDGCPSGYEARTVGEWNAAGYPGAPPFVDDPANGGNGDGTVCGRALGDGIARHNGLTKTIYQFHDNTVPA